MIKQFVNASRAGLRSRQRRANLSGVTSLVHRPALFSATLAPIFFIGGTLVAEAMSPGFDPVVHTISELAALDAPTRVFMTPVFVLTSLSHAVTAVFAIGIGILGRITIGIAAVASLAVAFFPLPTMAGTSPEHRTAAIIGFVALAAWPVLGMRLGRQFPWIVRPLGASFGTAVMAVFCFWFLAVWANPEVGYLGLVERVAANIESLWPALVVWSLFVAERRARFAPAPLPSHSAAL